MIRSVIFDMGNVLIRWRPRDILEALNIPEEDWLPLMREVFNSVEWIQTDRGALTMEEAVASMCRRLPERLHGAARALTMDWPDRCLLPMEGMAELIREVKELGYGVYLLSHAKEDLPRYFARIPGSRYFAGRIVSADWRLVKPQPEIYETLFREFHLKPEECVFIDDLPLNVEGALCAGMPGAVFDGDMARLRRMLNAAGVPVKA